MNIGEVSKKYNISIDTIRYYEKVGLIGPISKNKSGIRVFNENDLRQVEFIKCLRTADLPIAALAKYMELYKIGDSTIKERRQILLDQKENIEMQLKDLQNAYDRLIYKIELYDNQLLEKNLEGNE